MRRDLHAAPLFARAAGAWAVAVTIVLCACRGSDERIATAARDSAAVDGAPLRASQASEAAAPSGHGSGSDASSAARTGGAPATYPIRWSAAVELHALSEVDDLLGRPDAEGFGELEREGKTVTPRTCRERAALHARGYAPTNTLEAQPDNYAMIRCGTLLLLKRARPSTSSFVHDVRFDASALAMLPATLATALSDEEGARVDKATRQGKSLRAYDPNARVVKSSDPSELTIREGTGRSTIVIQPQVWGDIDGDGVEDVVLSVINTATQGTYAGARLLVLTRQRPDAVLRSIEGAK